MLIQRIDIKSMILVRRKKSLTFSRFGIITVTLFILFSVLFQIILPFGDEPDFGYHAPRYQSEILSSNYILYHIFPYVLDYMSYISSCSIASSPLSMNFDLNYESCSRDYIHIVGRVFFVFLTFIPLFFVLICRSFFYSAFFFKKSSKEKFLFINRINALSISIVLSSYIYYSNVLSYDSLRLMLTSLLVLFTERIIFSLLILLTVFSMDVGDSIVIGLFISINVCCSLLIYKFGLKALFPFTFSLVLAAFCFGADLLYIASFVEPISDKVNSIIDSYKNINYHDKYPVILRPVVTFMSFVLFTPSYLKPVGAYFISLIALLLLFRRVLKNDIIACSSNSLEGTGLSDSGCEYVKRKVISGFFAAVTTVLVVIFVLPNYSTAKYYVFMLPFMFSFILMYKTKIKILVFVILINFVVLTEILLKYL